MQKCDFLKFKMAAILWNLEQFGPTFALHSGITQDICLQNMTGISVNLRALHVGPKQRFEHTFWILQRRRLHTRQTHIGPTFHVGPDYSY